MEGNRTIRIAAAVIADGAGRTLLVRKAGTRWFMQPGGKIEARESAVAALCRELGEELALSVTDGDLRYLGHYSAAAAIEAGHIVSAELFGLAADADPVAGAEIDAAVWVTPVEAQQLPLAPLTRECVLPRLLAGLAMGEGFVP